MTIEEEMQTYAIGAANKARAEGLLQGKLEDARKMLSRGMSIEDIIDITGLSAEQIPMA